MRLEDALEHDREADLYLLKDGHGLALYCARSCRVLHRTQDVSEAVRFLHEESLVRRRPGTTTGGRLAFLVSVGRRPDERQKKTMLG